MRIFGKRAKTAQTRIVRRSEQVVNVSPLKFQPAQVMDARRFEINDGPFRGFGSPPGKF